MDPCHVIGPAQHGLSEDLQQALRESVSGDVGFRSMMGPEGPFLPAGLLNSGNSCFWNALVQALFFSVPQFRSALFQMDMDDLHFKHFSQQARQTSLPEVLGLMRDLFVEMEMGLTGAIDAGKLYNSIFQRAEEADVSEQMQHFFELASQAAPLKVVCQLFRGELHEHLRGGERRQVPLDFFQLDLCVSKPRSLPDLLEDHVNDVHGSILRRSYALPQVLWLNLDRFRFDRKEMKGRKRRVRVSFPERLCAWMLTDECCVQAPESRETEKSQKSQKSPELSEGRRLAEAAPAESSPAALIWSRQNLQAELLENQQLLQKTTQEEISKSTENQESTEESLLMAERIAERQEELMQSLQALEEQLMRVGEDKGWVYEVQAVIIHKGLLDTGHYFTYARMPSSQCSSTWCCLNDSSVSISSFEEAWHRFRFSNLFILSFSPVCCGVFSHHSPSSASRDTHSRRCVKLQQEGLRTSSLRVKMRQQPVCPACPVCPVCKWRSFLRRACGLPCPRCADVDGISQWRLRWCLRT